MGRKQLKSAAFGHDKDETLFSSHSNALNVMTESQKAEWGSMNAGHCVDGEGITRNHERQKIIDKASASGLIKEPN